MTAFDFPSSPTLGQVSNGYTWDGEKWTSGGAGILSVVKIQKFIASGTYTPDPNLSYAIMETVGNGGGGGGVLGGAGLIYTGGGGGSGSYSRTVATAAMIGGSQVVTIGAVGTGGVGAVAGTSGGNVSIGALCVANGGGGGEWGSNTLVAKGGAGGAPGTGDIATAGAPGQNGFYNSFNAVIAAPAGGGASSIFGGGATPAGGGGSNGNAGRAYGGGGSGAAISGAGTFNGGAGSLGIAIITEFCFSTQGVSDGGSASFKKNYIINGAMQVSQENGATAGSTAGYYPVDMFAVGFANGGVQSFAQVTSITPGGSPNRIRYACVTADAAVAAGDYALLQHSIEGWRVPELWFGLASAKSITVRFGVRGPQGTYCFAIRNSPALRCYVAEYTITALEAGFDKVVTITIPGDVTGTWATDNTASFSLVWTLMAGTTWQQTAGSWQATTNKFATANQSNFMSSNTNIFELFDVGLYEGTSAPAFVVPDYPSELQLCKRYFQYEGFGNYWIPPLEFSAQYRGMTMRFNPQMRAAPVITQNLGSSGGFAAGYPSATAITSQGYDIRADVAAPVSTGYTYISYFKANARI